MSTGASLAVLPSLPVRVRPSGKVVMTKKFIEGMSKYATEWDGPITAFMEPTSQATTNLDEVEIERADLPFHLEVVSFTDPKLGSMLSGYALALGALTVGQDHLAKLCRSINVPCVYVSEYSLRTRLEIIRSEKLNPIVSIRRQVREWQRETLYRKAVRLSSGMQCNGSPTYEAYRPLNSNALLFFDTRVSEEMLVTSEQLEKRAESMLQGRPLRLMFSGRLISMKGASHLIPVAEGLRKRGVPFEMTICGDGDQAPGMKAEIERLGLGDVVKMAGILDFQNELVPLTKHQTDLFVCCHRSGDPSCTYLEVMACGVPIAGYDNDAFVGIVKESAVGWLSPMNHPDQLAEKIAGIAQDRPALLQASRNAAEFGRVNTFDRTFKKRIEHMKATARLGLGRPEAI